MLRGPHPTSPHFTPLPTHAVVQIRVTFLLQLDMLQTPITTRAQVGLAGAVVPLLARPRAPRLTALLQYIRPDRSHPKTQSLQPQSPNLQLQNPCFPARYLFFPGGSSGCACASEPRHHLPTTLAQVGLAGAVVFLLAGVYVFLLKPKIKG